MDMEQHNDLDSLRIARQWLDRFSFSAATRNLDDHMALISRQVQVYGLASGVVDYAGFRRRRHNEFAKKLLLSLTYKGLELVKQHEGEINFVVKETMKSSSGVSFVLDKEVQLLRESDGEWRVVLETIRLVTRK